jgi:hypothetical protein
MESTTVLHNTANARLRENSVQDLWRVTQFVASHTAVVMQGGHTHEILSTLAKLREQISELPLLE